MKNFFQLIRISPFNHIHIMLVVVCILTAVSACQKSAINGDLDGQWQVMEVTPEPPETIITERMYYCFSLHSTQLTYYGKGMWTSGNLLDYHDNKLVLEYPYAKSDSSIARLKQYGIYTNPVTFTIENIDKNKLILRDGEVVVTLRKF